jgi:membrane protein DedA with SNARE-associated domain
VTANGIVSLPSSQFIYVTAGFLVAAEKMELAPVLIAGTLGNTIGNGILYEVSRRRGIGYVTRWRMFPEEKIVSLRRAFDRRGTVIIFVGKFLPGVKVVIPVVAGIAAMNRAWYTAVIAASSFLWALGLTAFGLYFGKNLGDGSFGWWSCLLLALAALAVYAFHRYVKSVSLER